MNRASLLLDTHVWFRYQASTKALRNDAVVVIDEAAQRNAVFVSVISVWELAMLEHSGYVEFDGGVQDWTDQALAKPGLSLLPLSPEIAVASVRLPPPMHKDPADRILVASALVENLTFVTSDKAILAFAKTTEISCLRA